MNKLLRLSNHLTIRLTSLQLFEKYMVHYMVAKILITKKKKKKKKKKKDKK